MSTIRHNTKKYKHNTNKNKNNIDNNIDDIDNDEKWRLINESGILKQIPTTNHHNKRPYPMITYLLASGIYTIPLFILYVIMELLVHQQYSEYKSWSQVTWEQLPTIAPILYMIVFIIHYLVHLNWLQYSITGLSIILGSRMMYLVLGQHTYGDMLTVPGLAVTWIYFIAQMRLSLALGSLFLVGIYVTYYNTYLKPIGIY